MLIALLLFPSHFIKAHTAHIVVVHTVRYGTTLYHGIPYTINKLTIFVYDVVFRSK